MIKKQHYVQYGCALSAPKQWTNYDVSPTLIIQRTPIIGYLLKSQLNIIFPKNVKYGDIIKGLPVKENSCNGIYCSHTLEHLSLNDFRKALKNTYRILDYEGTFRFVVPDLEWAARAYINSINENKEASIEFMNNTLLGKKVRPRGLKGFINTFLGNSNHLWMWDKNSLEYELEKIGFKDIRVAKFNDCEDKMFIHVEEEGRFKDSIAMECKKLL